MESNLANLSDHFASSTLISSLVELVQLEDLEDDFFLAGSLAEVVFLLLVAFSALFLFLTYLP